MRPASFRNVFFDVLHELTDVAEGGSTDGEMKWNVEFLARGSHWYYYHGRTEGGRRFSSGIDFDRQRGLLRLEAPGMLTIRLLDFQDNALIAAYAGDEKQATQIASDVIRGFVTPPEILSLYICREDELACSTVMSTSTSFVFVGFEKADDVDDVGTGKNLAGDTNLLSTLWFRARTQIVRKPVQSVRSAKRFG